jgi:hypothetical protein
MTGGNLVSFLQTEIRQQPQVIMTLLDREIENAQRIAADLQAPGVKKETIQTSPRDCGRSRSPASQ